MARQMITTCLWYDTNAEEAVKLYTSIFKDSKVGQTTHYGQGSPMPAGTVMTVQFELDGKEFIALNGGPHYKFTEAISLVVNCDTQKEVDEYWAALSAGGEEGPCGWLKDRFGVSWQVVPRTLIQMLGGPDRERSSRVTQAMFQMKKLDIAKLEQAYGKR